MDHMVRQARGAQWPEEAGAAQDWVRFDLKSAVSFTRRRWKTIFLTALGVLVLIGLAAAQLDRRYTASTLLIVDSRASQLVSFDAVADAVSTGLAIEAEVEIARSPSVIERVIRSLQLWRSPEFAPRAPLLERLMVTVGLSDPIDEALPQRWEDFSTRQRLLLIDDVQRALEVQRRPLTTLIEISATAESPDLAAAIANATAESYLAEQTDERVRSTQRAVDFLRERVSELGQEIDDLEAELEGFVTTKLAELGSAEARAMLLTLERNGQSRTGLVRSLNDLQSALDERDYARVTELVGGTLADQERRRASLMAQLEPSSLDASATRRIETELAQIEDEIRSAAAERAALLRTQIADADRSGAQLRSRLETELSQQDVPREVGTELFRLQRDAEIRRNLYSTYLTKLRQVEQQSVFDLPDSRVASPATPPREASFPPLRVIAAGGLFVALFAGFGMALLREYYVGGVTSVEQLEAAGGVPVIASVPVFRPGGGGNANPDLAIVLEPLSAFSESIRRMRLGIEAHVREEKYCVFVTSALPGEGKTTLALALARSFALNGARALLIDADFRRPSVGAHLPNATDSGLANYLRDRDGTARPPQIVREEETGLHLIIGGQGTDEPTDSLVQSARFTALLQRLRDEYDIVVLDTSPVGLVVDPLIVARQTNVGLFVVRFESTAQGLVRDAVRELKMAADIPICAVLNQDRSTSGYGKSYDAYYR